MGITRGGVRNLMTLTGAKRIQPQAIDLLVEYLEEVTREATQRALKFMKHTGRITLHTDDMQMALEVLKRL